jgi:hypothetical protein
MFSISVVASALVSWLRSFMFPPVSDSDLSLTWGGRL